MPPNKKPKVVRKDTNHHDQSRPRQTKQQKQKPAKPAKPKAAPEKTSSTPITVPFHDGDRILLIGEGDFSFAKSIIEHHGCYEVTATCYDGKEALFDKYKPQVEEHVTYIEDEGQKVLYSIDATKLDKDKKLKAAGGQWDVVLFNFPHVGGKSKDVNRQVRFNQELLVSFFQAASAILAEGGTIVVTLFEGEPYTLWNVRDLARHSGLEVQRSFKFQAEAYPGYSHARTLGNIEGGGGWKGEDREARSYVFQKKGCGGGKLSVNGGTKQSANGGKQPGNSGNKRKRATGGDSSDEDG